MLSHAAYKKQQNLNQTNFSFQNESDKTLHAVTETIKSKTSQNHSLCWIQDPRFVSAIQRSHIVPSSEHASQFAHVVHVLSELIILLSVTESNPGWQISNSVSGKT